MRKTNILQVAVHNLLRFCVAFFCFLSAIVVNAQNYEKLPYFEGFEDAVMYDSWELNVGPNGQNAENKWCVSTAESFVGKQALYISADDGKTLSYTDKLIYNVAYREIFLPKGTYDLSFTWKCEGELGADGLYVCWVSSKMPTISSAADEPTFIKNTKLVFDGMDFLCGSKEWKTSTTTLTQQSSTAYKLVFVWKNDASNNTPSLPSIVIDNIQIGAQGCGKPESVAVNALSSDITVRWAGGATGYELMYRRYGEEEVHEVKNINQTSYTIKGMEEGVYDVFVRSCCPDDTSVWVVKNNVLVYDAASHCIDFINWDREGTTFETGVHTTGGRFNGDKFYPNITPGSLGYQAVDFGYNSENSRHTKHYIPGEMDARTGNELPTVPEGEVVSVRLGNWKIGGEFESVTYSHHIDSGSNMILLLKYAVVIEDPGHDREEQPVFMLELLDERGNPLDASGCGDANFVANTKELIENPNADGTWHMIKKGDKEIVLWKEWTTVGINMTEYAKYGPLDFKIRLTVYDCAQGGHFGYAYYTLNCEEATIEGLSCGENAGANIKAPVGFNYRWYRVRDNKTVCTTQNLQGLEKNDTALYRCKVMFAQDSACYFELDASLLPKLPKAQFSPRWTPRYCNENYVKFQNTSHVTTERGATGEKCETHRWYLREGDGWKLIHDGDDGDLEYRFPNEGGKFDVRLETGISNDDCVDDTIITVNVSRLGAVIDTICDTICEGKSVKIEGRRYMQEGVYRVYRGTSFGGCDSTVYLDLKVIPKERDTVLAYTCGNAPYIFNGQEFVRSGKYRTVYKADSASNCECDTVVTLFLTVAKMNVPDTVVLCSGDDLQMEFTMEEKDFSMYEIQFDAAAKSVGLKDLPKQALPIDGVIKLGVDKISTKATGLNPIRPGKYVMNIIAYYTDEYGVEQSCSHNVLLDVLYATNTMQQKFNNLITLLDEENNGGYKFDSYQWYKNGEPLEGENNTYLYIEDETLVNEVDVYNVGLVREGETEEILCCGMRFDLGTAVETVEYLGVDIVKSVIGVGEQVLVLFDNGKDECVARWWSATGVMLGEQSVVGNGALCTTPQWPGIYLLELVVGDERVVRKIVISN